MEIWVPLYTALLRVEVFRDYFILHHISFDFKVNSPKQTVVRGTNNQKVKYVKINFLKIVSKIFRNIL